MEELQFNICRACELIQEYGFSNIVLQFPDHIAVHCVDVYNDMVAKLPSTINIFIATDSTYGSSIDDISALHVRSDVLVYFGTDLSSSGSIPVMVLPPKKVFDALDFELQFKSIENTLASMRVFVVFDPCYSDFLILSQNLIEKLLMPNSKQVIFGKLPLCADLTSWSSDIATGKEKQFLNIGGLWFEEKPEFAVNSSDVAILYIGDKDEQLTAIYLAQSQHPIVAYFPQKKLISLIRGDQTRDFQQRSGCMLKVKCAATIGIIIGSMGLTSKSTQSLVNRLQLLIAESGRKYFAFAMGRLNEAKLSNFPEIDLFVLIGNDDTSLIPAKSFHVPVITPWELELGLGVRNWTSVFKSPSESILVDDSVTIEIALERARASRVENQVDSDVEEYDVENKPSDGSALTIANTYKELVTMDRIGTAYYQAREFKGLEIATPTDREDDTTIHAGLSGMAAGYSHFDKNDTDSSCLNQKSSAQNIKH